jgi:hypothetical protein
MGLSIEGSRRPKHEWQHNYLSEGGLTATRDLKPVGVSTSILILITCKSMHIEAKHFLSNKLFTFPTFDKLNVFFSRTHIFSRRVLRSRGCYSKEKMSDC